MAVASRVVAKQSVIKFAEGVKEMIVSADSCCGDEVAHRKRIDQRVVEILVGECLRGGYFPIAAHWWRWLGLPRSRRSDKRIAGKVHAKALFRSDANKRLRIDTAAQVVVQVRALRHAHKKRMQVERIRASGLERSRRALFGSRSRRGSTPGGGLRINAWRPN